MVLTVLAMDPMIGAISAGCAVCLKASEVSPATSSLLARLVPKYLDSDAVQVDSDFETDFQKFSSCCPKKMLRNCIDSNLTLENRKCRRKNKAAMLLSLASFGNIAGSGRWSS